MGKEHGDPGWLQRNQGDRVELAGGMADLEVRRVVWRVGKGALSSSHISDSGGAATQNQT